MFPLLIAIAAALSQGDFAWANRCADLLTFADPAEQRSAINVERFYGYSASFAKTLRAILVPSSDADSGLQVLNYGPTINADHSRLGSNDSFALGIMAKRKVITNSDASYYSGISADFEPDQITNIEVVDYLPEDQAKQVSEARGKAAGVGEAAMVGGYFQFKNGESDWKKMYAVRTATLRLISGQVPKQGTLTEEPVAVAKNLPWMKEFPEAAKKIDRNHYKFVWELGRAGQIGKGVMKKNLAVAGFVALRELQALGGNIDAALITAHAPNPLNRELYVNPKFGYAFEPLFDDLPKPGHSIVAMPLKDLLKHFPPEEVFTSLKTILADTGLDEITAIGTVDNLLDLRRMQFRVTNPFDRKMSIGLVVRDFSNNLDATGERFVVHDLGDSPHSRAIAPILAQHSSRLLENDFSAQRDDFATLQGAFDKKTGRPMAQLEVSGIDQALEAADKKKARETIAGALLGALEAYRDRLHEAGIKNPDFAIKDMIITIYSAHGAEIEKFISGLGLSPVQFEGFVGAGPFPVAVTGSDLLEFSELNTGVRADLKPTWLNARSSRVFQNPLNF